jgi:hypothetical protein
MLKMKLTKEQKAQRKEMKRALINDKGFFITLGDTETILLWPNFLGSDNYLMSMAIKHPNDEYNRKYGEWVALTKYENGDSIEVSRVFVDMVMDFAEWQ